MAENWRSFADDTKKQICYKISMPKALRIFLDFQMLVEYLLGGNTAA